MIRLIKLVFIQPKSAPLLLNFITVILFSGCINIQNIRQQKEDVSCIQELLEKASQKSDTGRIDAGIRFLDSAVAGKQLNIREQFKTLAFKCGYHYRLKDAERAMIYADSMMQLIENNNPQKYKEEYSLASYSKGDILLMMNKTNEAYTCYYNGHIIGRYALDSCTLGEYSYRIAMLLFQQSRFNEAAENFKQAFAETNACDDDFVDFFRRQEILNNAGLSFQRAGNDDSALIYFNKALKYITGHDGKYINKLFFNEIAKGVVYHCQGETYLHKGNYQLAGELLQKSIAINSKKGYDNCDAQLSMLKLAQVYYVKNNMYGMSYWLKKARQSLDTIRNEPANMEWNRLMWKFYDNKKDSKQAYKYLSAFTHMQDSVYARNALASSSVSEQIRIIEDQNEIKNLQKDNQLKNLYLLLFISITALAAVIVSFSLYVLKNTRRNVKQLEGLNKQIAEQKHVLEKTLAQLEERNKEKDIILRAVAHDLRSPVANVSMLAEAILNETCEDSREEMLRMIKTSSKSSLNLINEILEAAGIENDKEFLKEKTGINDLLKNSVEMLRFRALEKRQQLLLAPLKDNKDIFVNKEKMERVINNLITNAIKFSSVETTIDVKAIQKKSCLQIVISDYGIGIPDNLKPKVFNMFSEAKRTGTSGERPFGLGLSICKQIVEAHGGSIWFESEPGKGTLFFVELQTE
jgi:signal transduction histidine kinase